MKTKIVGTITSLFPDDINTDDIIPAWVLQESTERSFFKRYAFSNYDKEFINRLSKEEANIIVAGENFGCGSSREQAVYALQENKVVAVIAKSFPDIFYRNCLNNGLVLAPVGDISPFKFGQRVMIDLKKKEISVGDKKIPIKVSDEDAKTFSLGGKSGKIKKHLTQILKQERLKRSGRVFNRFPRRIGEYAPGHYVKAKIKSEKPQTIVEKIISSHLARPVFAGERLEKLPIDILFFNEVIGPSAIRDFFYHFGDIFKRFKKEPKIFSPKRVFFIPDHTVPSSSVAVSEGITLMETFAKRQGAKCYKEGDGIEHQVLIEDGYIVPGELILGTDSHTCTNGVLNALAFGIGTTDAAFALATGFLYDFLVPQTIRFNLFGKFKKGVYSKDLILQLIGKLGVDGLIGKVAEFGGPGLKNLSIDARATIANMAVEMGARTAIFELDDVLKKYLSKRAKFPFKFYNPDFNCQYEKIIDVNLGEVEPTVAFPHKPSNVVFISKIKDYLKKSQKSKAADFPTVESLKITDAFLGSCTNGRYEDLLEAAKIIKGKKVHKDVNFIVIPASRKIYLRLLKEGILSLFAEAGANIESPNCGLCFGKHMGVVGKGAKVISSSNRNYIGRMGSPEAEIFLASPATVTASAIAGKITDPRKFL
ncbi:MAG: aconitase/3-isopropylmalate dehydratase large subunit family protein [Patescibacteria group bacterium]|nr:aconitase/3-isopropylmalate dehydratase large subunit family protein [Patescibacteria group bacterium]